jgi:hypothetical protein
MISVIIFAPLQSILALMKKSCLDMPLLFCYLSFRQWQHIRQVFNKLWNVRALVIR